MKLKSFLILISIVFVFNINAFAQSAKAFFTAGVVELTNENYDQAIDNFNNAIKLDKGYIDAFFNRAIAYEGIDEDKKALKDYSYVIKKKPETVDAYINRGLLYFKLDENEKAISDFSIAIKLNPDNSFAFLHRARVYFKINENSKAKDDYLRVLQKLPSLLAVHADLIEIYLAEGDYESCITHYDFFIILKPDNAQYYEARAIAYEKIGDNLNACSDYKKAKELGITTLDNDINRVCGN